MPARSGQLRARAPRSVADRLDGRGRQGHTRVDRELESESISRQQHPRTGEQDSVSRSGRCLRSFASRLAAALLLLVPMLPLIACESTPVRSIRGARHYAEGSEALERGESTRAIAELERAAHFVPRASEIQNHLGLAYWAGGQVERARLAFEHAVDLDCDNRAAQRNLERLDATQANEDAERKQHGG